MPESLSSLVIWLVGVIALSIAIHAAVVFFYPYLVMTFAFREGLRQFGRNTITHSERPTAAYRGVVRPSPDLSYSGCVYDLSEGPLYLRAIVPNTYMSLSMYANNTDNFFRINDLEIQGPELKIMLIGPSDAVTHTAVSRMSQVVRSPSTKGILLFRYFQGDELQTEELEHIRHQTVISRLPQPEYALASVVRR